MAFDITIFPEALEHLLSFPVYYRRIVHQAIEQQLTHNPTEETLHKKQMEPNELARWELRVRDYRVFYDVIESESRVLVVAVGKKEHDRLVIGGKEVNP